MWQIFDPKNTVGVNFEAKKIHRTPNHVSCEYPPPPHPWAIVAEVLHTSKSGMGSKEIFLSCLISRGYSQGNWVGVCSPLPKTLTLFMTKICDFSSPIYDLFMTWQKNWIPCLWPSTLLLTKMAAKWLKSIPYLWPKRVKTHTFGAAHTYITNGIKICKTTATNRWECRIFSRPGSVENLKYKI